MNRRMITVNERHGITLGEAFALLTGELREEMLTPEKASCIRGDRNAEEAEIILEADAVYFMDENGIRIPGSCIVRGNGAVIKGCAGNGFIVAKPNILIENVNFDNFKVPVLIKGGEQGPTENIKIMDCKFTNISMLGVAIGSDRSGGVIKNVIVDNCEFIGCESFFTDDGKGGTGMIAVTAAFFLGKESVNNCLLDGLRITRNKFLGKYRITIQVNAAIGVCITEGFMPECVCNEIKNVEISDNYMEESFDAAINFMGSCMNQKDTSIHDFKILRNEIKHGIWGIYMAAVEPYYGTASDGRIYNFELSENLFYPVEQGCGENCYAIATQGSRVDFVDGTVAEKGSCENFKITKNTFRNVNVAIHIAGADQLLDAPDNYARDSFCKDYLIEGNEFLDVDDPIQIYGVQHEGRRVDWNIGLPPHEKFWAELLPDRNIVASKSDRNYVKDIIIRDNHANGYRFKYKISGISGMGQGEVKNNYVENVLIENNTYEHGEGHVRVKDGFYDDLLRDGGGNHIKDIVER